MSKDSSPAWAGDWGREIERNLFRARNGLKMAWGTRFAEVGMTPKDTVWRSRKAELWRYRSSHARRHRTPLLLYIGLVSRSYVLDLHPGNSLVERLLQKGYDVFVLDWGIPDEADAESGLEVYVDELLPRAIRAVLKAAGTDHLNLFAYCMGGTLTLMMMGTRDFPSIRSLVTIAAPVDFSEMGSFYEPLVSGKANPDRMIDETGNLPANVIYNMVRVRRPTGDLVQYANLCEKMWNVDFLEGFQAMREWVVDHIPLPGRFFREVLQGWLIENGFVNGTLRLAGRPVDLSRIEVPVLCIVAEHDEMIPYGAAIPLPELLTAADAQCVVLKSGHVSLVCGRSADHRTMPILDQWLQRHSDPMLEGEVLGE